LPFAARLSSPHNLPASPVENSISVSTGNQKTFNPLLVEDGQSETIRYLTGGVLIRLNRQTQVLEPALAVSWKSARRPQNFIPSAHRPAFLR